MSNKSASISARISNDKLYQAYLDACIHAIENFPVDLRKSGQFELCLTSSHNLSHQSYSASRTITTKHRHQISRMYHTAAAEGGSASSVELCSTSSLLFPPLPIPRTGCREKTSSLPPKCSSVAMDRSRYSNTPSITSKGLMAQGAVSSHKPSAQAAQPTPSNLAVQPVETPGIFKLKKSAVKIVAAAGHLPATPTQFAASTLLPVSSRGSVSIQKESPATEL
jgi:hypothetical protein